MKFQFLAGTALALLFTLNTGTVFASEELADKNACLNCHQVNKKSIGPSFKAVADKYRGQSDAAAKLVLQIKQGGSGVWGKTMMPPMAQVSEAESKQIVAWILSQK